MIAAVALAALAASLAALVLRPRRSRMRAVRRPASAARRIVFPFMGRALSQRALDAALRVASAEGATLVPVYLALVPLGLPLEVALPKEAGEAMPLLEAVEHRATAAGVAVDARIERGRTYRHAVRELLAHERYDRLVVAADTAGTDGFGADDIAWLLRVAAGEVIVVRPAQDTLIAGRGSREAIRPAPRAPAVRTPAGVGA